MINKKPDQRLAELGAIYKERNAVYGDTYRNFGKVMKGFFPGPITISTEQEWNRMALFFHCADKLARYAGSFFNGGHVDSLDDNSVYSQMLQEYDHEARDHRGLQVSLYWESKDFQAGGHVANPMAERMEGNV